MLFGKTNEPIHLIPINYFKLASRTEKLFDLGVPIFITLILTVLGWLYVNDLPKFLTVTKDINNAIIAMLSILASFNMASVTIFATSSSPLIVELARKPLKKYPTKSELEQVISFFCWAIILQLSLLVLCFLYYFIAGFLIPDKPYAYILSIPFNWFIPLWIFVFVWISATLHSIFVSIRNVAGLFLYLVAAGKRL